MDPFEYDDDNDAAAADDRLKKQMDDEIQSGTSPEGDIEIPIGPDPEGDFDLEPPEDRAAKKANRYKEARAQAEQEREKRMQAEARAAALEAIHATQMGAPKIPSEDPIQKDIDNVYNERMRLAEQYNQRMRSGEMTADEDKDLRARARDLEEKSNKLQFLKFKREDEAKRDPVQERIAEIRRQNPDVSSNNNAWNWADGRARQRLAQGETYSYDFVQSVMEEARREFKIGKYRGDPRDPAKYASPPRGSGAGMPSKLPSRMTMTEEARRMADAAFPGIKDDKKRWQHWAKTAGRSFLEMERKAGR